MGKKYRKKKKKQKRILLFLILIFLLLLGVFLLEKQRAAVTEEQEKEGQIQVTDKEEREGLQVHFIDVGQGDATLITCGEHAMLIDAGNNNMGTRIQQYLKKQGVERLDYVIGTHPDADHIGGLDVVITKFDCGIIMMPDVYRKNVTYRDVLDAISYRRYQNTLPVVGQQYDLGDAVFTVVAPNGNYKEEYNNYSIGILLEYGERKFLFVGDAEAAAEQDMLANGISLKADVLKVGHHGSSDSSSDAFLEAVDPQYAVISCGADNEYGHPHKKTLYSLKESDVLVYRTDEQGSMTATCDGQTISFDQSPSVTWKSGWE